MRHIAARLRPSPTLLAGWIAAIFLAIVLRAAPLTAGRPYIAYVDEGAINNISNGQSVDITVDSYSGTSLSGHVQQIVQAAAGEFSLLPTEDKASGNFTKVGQRIPVLISLDGTGGKDLVPGMSAEVTIHLH